MDYNHYLHRKIM